MKTRPVLLALGAIAALVVASVVVILRATGGDGPPPRPPAAALAPAPAPIEPAPPAPLPSSEALVPPPPFTPSGPREQQVLLPPPPRNTWEAVPLVPMPRALGRAGLDIDQALEQLRPRVAQCFSEDAQARFGPVVPTASGAAVPADDPGNPTLLLYLETGDGEVTVVDAPLEQQSRASDGLVSCAQAVLKGRRLQAADVKPGSRYRWRFTVSP